eukprot:9586572-Alexandrium_andersonii.AAC.1
MPEARAPPMSCRGLVLPRCRRLVLLRGRPRRHRRIRNLLAQTPNRPVERAGACGACAGARA